jgi:starch synthase (maltosyl-transferring)
MTESLKRRVVIERVAPEIDCGRFPVKRVVGESVVVEADAFTDGHDALSVVLLHRRPAPEVAGTPAPEVPGTPREETAEWMETPMEALGNDRFRGTFPVLELGRYEYTVEAWIDRFGSWRRDLEKRVAARQKPEELAVDLRIGADLLREAAKRVPRGRKDAKILKGLADSLGETAKGEEIKKATALALDPETAAVAGRYPDRDPSDGGSTRYARTLAVVADRERARFSTWYETFPRSTGQSGSHGTFATLEKRLPYIAGMGFDVLYLPPIHPIGDTHRKGKNNARTGKPGDVGSPWAIGNRAAASQGDGGHESIHPELGTPEDFRHLVAAAREHGLEIALDVAFQCSPDHPYVHEHPEWFRKRPDGTIQYAENPPKKYEDIVPFDFECDDWRALWQELEGVFLHWIGEGVEIFRVDNPHTKSLRFWEWVIPRIKARHPEVIFLSEAFTRPKVMYRLAKGGFTQSYNYFPWRSHKQELSEYLTELTRTEVAEYFRPNLWPNTPDILTEVLQTGGRPAFVMRFLLAATLGASYGIYGPPFELMESTPREPGSEEYLDSEKYQLRSWGGLASREDSLAELIARVNRARREHPALQTNESLRFHGVDNGEILAYSKTPVADAIANPRAEGDAILAFVNLDPHHTQSGWTDLDLGALGVDDGADFQVEDLLTGAKYTWHGRRNYVELDPRRIGAHLFQIAQGPSSTGRDEEDFDSY